MRYSKAAVSSPASIANFGPGFDSFGLCLDTPRDIVTVRKADAGVLEVKVLGSGSVPTDPMRNTASYAALKLAEACGRRDVGFTMTVKKGMKPGSGIGSSAASSVGGALAMAAMLGVKDKKMVLEAAAMGEELISGAMHFDNVAAALYGGFTVVSDARKRTILQIRPPKFDVVVVVPDVTVETRRARAVLPEKVHMRDAVSNLSLASGMVHAMMKRDVRAIASHLDDCLAIPHRKPLVPGYDAVRQSALAAGAMGVSLGGSGPAVFAIALGGSAKIRSAMAKAFKDSAGLDSESFVTRPGEGARIESVAK
jgi:homoserine kinase